MSESTTLSTNPGPCLNSDCIAKPYGMFVPVDEDPCIALLGKCCACGCLGVQHYKSNAGKASPVSATPKPSPRLASSAGTTHTSTLPSSGAYERLKACAKDRKAQLNASQMDDVNPNYDLVAKVISQLCGLLFTLSILFHLRPCV
ncbi:hypothetical protein K439DRAFT_1613895 [Ramaria rubella]|nr:hypothetical protein K439DRAFT_1613895 [Ramaria rubella]